MKLYYKFLFPTFFAIFMTLCTYVIICIAIEKFRQNGAEGVPVLIFILIFGFVVFFYGKMAFMRLRKIPVIELTENTIIIRDVLKKSVIIPYKYIKSFDFNDSAIGISYRINKENKKTFKTFRFINIDNQTFHDLINELQNRIAAA